MVAFYIIFHGSIRRKFVNNWCIRTIPKWYFCFRANIFTKVNRSCCTHAKLPGGSLYINKCARDVLSVATCWFLPKICFYRLRDFFYIFSFSQLVFWNVFSRLCSWLRLRWFVFEVVEGFCNIFCVFWRLFFLGEPFLPTNRSGHLSTQI